MNLCIAQINPVVGDILGNGRRIRDVASQACTSSKPDLVVFPEMCVSGYPPKDLLLQEGFVEACEDAAADIAAHLPRGVVAVIGLPRRVMTPSRCALANSVMAISNSGIIATYDKRLLPTYDVFDESRYFMSGDRAVVIQVAGINVGLSICEDLWMGEDVGELHRYHGMANPIEELVAAGAQVILNPSASPFVLGKWQRHRNLLRRHAAAHRVTVVGVNQVGGNDELIFDGNSAVFGPGGDLVAAARSFEPDMVRVDFGTPRSCAADPAASTSDAEMLFRALVLGIRDYLRKTGFASAILGLSGGIDSAVTAVLAVAALGPSAVFGVALPSCYSSEGSVADARTLAARLGIQFDILPIEDARLNLERALTPFFAGTQPGVAEENIQARLRGTLLMALSNKFARLLLTTGNKSELAVGYCTLYGDMNGGLAVLSDVTKQWVYRLAEWINGHPASLGIPGLSSPPIPESTIAKAPSAELRPNQTDQDSLPPYPVLDEIIERYVQRRQSAATILAETGFDESVVRRMLRLIDINEYKRKQAATGLKVTGVAFGTGRRYPIAQRFTP